MFKASKFLKRNQKSLIVGGVVIVVVVGTASIVHMVRSQQSADRALNELTIEFQQVPPPSGATQLHFESSHKGSLGGISSEYDSAKSYAEIKKHYDGELTKHGWKFVGDKPVRIWWKDYGGKEAFWCKKSYTATLEYAGSASLGWTYGFGMSWGTFDECNE